MSTTSLKTALAQEAEKWVEGTKEDAVLLAEKVLTNPEKYLDSIDDPDLKAEAATALQDALTNVRRRNRAVATAVIRFAARAAIGALA